MKKLSTTFILIAAIVCLSVTALAAGLVFSSRVDAAKLAEKAMADTYGVIIVMPDGGFDSWYYDSPVEPTYRYETFVARELVEYIDSHYRTKAEPSARAIAGLSMGGHGALYLAIRHQNVFGAAGSLSGGVDIRPFPDNWNIA